MTVISDLIVDLRRMVVEPLPTTYTDLTLAGMIEKTAVIDTNGLLPEEFGWVETYNLYKVAAEIWIEKAAGVADEFDQSSDGGNFQRSQKHAMYLKQANYYQGRSKSQSLQIKQSPLSNLTSLGFEDLPYKDDIDEHEQNLV